MSDDRADMDPLSRLLSQAPPQGPNNQYARLRALRSAGRVGDPLTLSSQSVVVPPPLPFPETLGPSTGVDFLVKAYVSAAAWTELPPGVERVPSDRLKYAAAAQLKGKSDDIIRALHELRERSKLSPVVWAWWCIQSDLEYQVKTKGETSKISLPSAARVFSYTRFSDPKIRAIFWKDGMEKLHENQVLWPKAILEVMSLSREYTEMFMASPQATDDELVAVWDLMYNARFQELSRECATQRVHIRNKISAAVQRQDLALWLSSDLIAHLRLQKEATIKLVA